MIRFENLWTLSVKEDVRLGKTIVNAQDPCRIVDYIYKYLYNMAIDSYQISRDRIFRQ